jgi:hypothetical protein
MSHRIALSCLILSLGSLGYAQRPVEHSHSTASNQLAFIKSELGKLTADVAQLNQDFSQHLKNQGTRPSPEEAAVLEGIGALGESINSLVKESQNRISEQRVLRAFHMVDYNSKDLVGMAAKAGYSKAFAQPLGEIAEHVANLSEAGYANPRVKLEAAGGGLFSRGPVFRKDNEDKPLLRGPQPTQQPLPQTRPVAGGRYSDPTSVPQRPIPQGGPQQMPQQGRPSAGGGLGDILRTILGGGAGR